MIPRAFPGDLATERVHALTILVSKLGMRRFTTGSTWAALLDGHSIDASIVEIFLRTSRGLLQRVALRSIMGSQFRR